MLNAAQAIELEMLQECIRICEEHGIRYYLLGGSALGAVRHAGFIPWDDDIDVGMPRPDYDKFLSVAQAMLSDGLFVQTDTTDPSFPFTFSKIRDVMTPWADEANAEPSTIHRAQVDVFPLDGYPANALRQRVTAASFMLYRVAILRRLGQELERDDAVLRRLAKGLVIRVCVAVFSLESLRRRADSVARAYAYDECDVVINREGAWLLKEAVPREFFGEGRTVEFEGVTVTIPSDSDGYLRSLYGDYMRLPPVEQRVSPHYPEPSDVGYRPVAHKWGYR